MILSNRMEKGIVIGAAAIVVAAYVLTYSLPFRSAATGVLSEFVAMQSTAVDDAAAPAESSTTVYILPSDSRLLTEEDLAGLDQWTSTLAINELYARHGCQFGVAEIQDYFASQAWYAPDPNVTTESAAAAFTDVERANLDLLVAHAQANGWR